MHLNESVYMNEFSEGLVKYCVHVCLRGVQYTCTGIPPEQVANQVLNDIHEY